jgi:heme exporter protein D
LSFDSWGEFFAMGGHGFYVWLSYGLSLAVVLGNVLVTRNSRRQYLREQLDRETRNDTTT